MKTLNLNEFFLTRPKVNSKHTAYGPTLCATALEIIIDKEIANKNILDSIYAYVEYFYNGKLYLDELSLLYKAIDTEDVKLARIIIDTAEEKMEKNTFFKQCLTKDCFNKTNTLDSKYCELCEKETINQTPSLKKASVLN
tara:strand:- start:638 stop:1057 length:420 start_codon:yes stop_codon:yes gene_type:complete